MIAALWHEHRLADLTERQAESNDPYLEFLHTATLRAGLYVLPPDAEDLQRPHADDEIYYVLEGEGWFRIGGQTLHAVPGAVLYVPAGLDHRFERITNTLRLLVVFANSTDS